MPADGAAFVASKIDALAANPEVWAKTLFILNYDENDGIFDHVAPPVPPVGTPHEFVDGLPIGAGFRVPCILVSPWTTRGWVSSDVFDHTSVLLFLEKFTGVHERGFPTCRFLATELAEGCQRATDNPSPGAKGVMRPSQE
jgi:phospholipase C